MARVGGYAFLTMLAVIPFIAFGRPLGMEGDLSWAPCPYAECEESQKAEDVDSFAPWPWFADEDAQDTLSPGTTQQSEGASPNDNGLYFSIQSLFQPLGTARCADIDDNGNVVMADCEAGSTNQLWSSEDTVIKHYSGKCLEVCVTNCHYRFLGRKRVWIKDCTGNVAQQWLTIDGSRIQSKQNGDCMDVCDSMTCSPRGDVITYDCHDESNQKWGLILGGYAGAPTSQQAREFLELAEELLD